MGRLRPGRTAFASWPAVTALLALGASLPGAGPADASELALTLDETVVTAYRSVVRAHRAMAISRESLARAEEQLAINQARTSRSDWDCRFRWATALPSSRRREPGTSFATRG